MQYAKTAVVSKAQVPRGPELASNAAAIERVRGDRAPDGCVPPQKDDQVLASTWKDPQKGSTMSQGARRCEEGPRIAGLINQAMSLPLAGQDSYPAEVS